MVNGFSGMSRTQNVSKQFSERVVYFIIITIIFALFCSFIFVILIMKFPLFNQKTMKLPVYHCPIIFTDIPKSSFKKSLSNVSRLYFYDAEHCCFPDDV